jgi:murein DD-endopeptidase MepM/ murein hydrolase activator NlpD
MRYRILLKTLKILIYVKRFFWWLTSRFVFVLGRVFSPVIRFLGLISYKIDFVFKKIVAATGVNSQFVKRDNLQVIIFIFLLFLAVPQSVVYSKKDTNLPGQKTIAFAVTGSDEDYSVEEVVAEPAPAKTSQTSWREGALTSEQFAGSGVSWQEQELAGVVAGGAAVTKPILFPGAMAAGGRDKVIEYVVDPGDSLSGIAAQYGISVATLLWENNLGLTSFIRPGDKLKILPVTGLTHLIKKGDTLKKIAVLYEAKTEDIVSFNKLKEDGTDLVIGEKIIVPSGIKPQSRALATVPRTSPTLARVATPPSSKQSPSASGFVWPSGVHTITQYFGWAHYGLDIAGPLNTPNYAAKAGTVEKAQCGWNSGYGCYIIINHGGGVKTLYGHNNKILVVPGQHVFAGETIGLMGNTGKVRGRTGIHVHFEVQVNGVRVNPLGYVR